MLKIELRGFCGKPVDTFELDVQSLLRLGLFPSRAADHINVDRDGNDRQEPPGGRGTAPVKSRLPAGGAASARISTAITLRQLFFDVRIDDLFAFRIDLGDKVYG